MIEIKFIKGDTNTIILGIIILLLSQVNSVFIYIAKYHKLQFASRSLYMYSIWLSLSILFLFRQLLLRFIYCMLDIIQKLVFIHKRHIWYLQPLCNNLNPKYKLIVNVQTLYSFHLEDACCPLTNLKGSWGSSISLSEISLI